MHLVLDARSDPDEGHAVPDELARLAQVGWGNPHRGEQVASQQEGQPFRIHPIVLQPGRGDGSRPLRMGKHRLMPQTLQQVHQPPPRPRGLDGDPCRGWERGEELLDVLQPILQTMLTHRPFRSQHGDL